MRSYQVFQRRGHEPQSTIYIPAKSGNSRSLFSRFEQAHDRAFSNSFRTVSKILKYATNPLTIGGRIVSF